MRKPIPLLGPHGGSRIPGVNDQETINLYPMVESPTAKSQLVLYSWPGKEKITTAGTGPGRCDPYEWKGDIYFISGDTLYKMDTSDVVTAIGTLNTSTGWCVLAGGRTHLGIVDGTNGYYTDGSTLTQIGDADFPNGATHISYLDSYFICADVDTDQFFISASEDITSWNALDFASAESNPDDIEAHIANESTLYLFGGKTIQPFQTVPNADFPFDAYPNVIEYGIQAKYSLVRDEMGIYFLAKKPGGGIVVVRLSGISGGPLSSPEMTWELNQLTTTSDAIGSLYDMKGVPFYILSFPSESLTFAFNTVNGLCHRCKSYGIGRDRGLGYGSLANRQFCLDYDNGKVYELKLTEYTEDSTLIERYRRSQVISFSDHRVVYHKVILDVDAGVGNVDDTDPVVELRYSDDKGKTWSSWLSRDLGATGEYTTRCIWNRLGQSRHRIFEFRCTDKVAFNVIDAYADVEVLND